MRGVVGQGGQAIAPIGEAAREPLAPDSRVAILGAGPCGLACARELDRLGHRNWVILERQSHAGGLASSVIDPAGFTWDLGGHVVFSHFGEFDALLSEVMGEDICIHDRSSYVRFEDRWVPYPFQNNLRHLPAPIRDECLSGLAETSGSEPGLDFSAWMRMVFGAGITRHFMAPYNRKVWATELEQMSSDWIAERVSVIDYERAARNVADGVDDLGWGPNNHFVFPARGGTGEIYTRLAARLGERVRYGLEAIEIDSVAGSVKLSEGEIESYDALVSTMPLDQLVARIADCPEPVRDASMGLRHNGVYMVGVGYRAPLRDEKSWMYFPQGDVPFYRVTNFAKYAAANVPDADTERHCSYMTETAYSDQLPVARDGLEQRVERGLRSAGVVNGAPEVASVHVEEIPYAYPVPTLARDRRLAVIQPWLMAHRIYSRGRFGSWRYEIGNMDHAVKMGVDIARHLVRGTDEELWHG
jgi:protoporphyrinogen oxidase